MASLTDMVPSKSNYLAKKDTDERGMDLTIKKFTHETVGQGADKEEKLVVYWTDENVKPMVVNKSNANRIKRAVGSDDTKEIIGKTVNIYVDPDVEFGGEVVGGLRIRAAQNSAPGKPTARATPKPQVEDDGTPSPPIEAYDDPLPPF